MRIFVFFLGIFFWTYNVFSFYEEEVKSSKKYECFVADKEQYPKDSLISQMSEDLRDKDQRKTVLTLGFRKVPGEREEHAYIVFEQRQEEYWDSPLTIKGVHFVPLNGSWKNGKVVVEDAEEVLRKFVREKPRSQNGTIDESTYDKKDPLYTMFRSFASGRPWQGTNDLPSFSPNENCCTYACKIICQFGLDISNFHECAPTNPFNLKRTIEEIISPPVLSAAQIETQKNFVLYQTYSLISGCTGITRYDGKQWVVTVGFKKAHIGGGSCGLSHAYLVFEAPTHTTGLHFVHKGVEKEGKYAVLCKFFGIYDEKGEKKEPTYEKVRSFIINDDIASPGYQFALNSQPSYGLWALFGSDENCSTYVCKVLQKMGIDIGIIRSPESLKEKLSELKGSPLKRSWNNDRGTNEDRLLGYNKASVLFKTYGREEKDIYKKGNGIYKKDNFYFIVPPSAACIFDILRRLSIQEKLAVLQSTQAADYARGLSRLEKKNKSWLFKMTSCILCCGTKGQRYRALVEG